MERDLVEKESLAENTNNGNCIKKGRNVMLMSTN